MSDAERVLYFLGALVAAFVLAYLAGVVAGPTLGLDEPARHPEPAHHSAGLHPESGVTGG
jgi:hypothetical protein